MIASLPLHRLHDAVERMMNTAGAGEPTPPLEQALAAFEAADPADRVEAAARLLVASLRVAVWYRVPLAGGFSRNGFKTELMSLPAAAWGPAGEPTWPARVAALTRTLLATTRRYRAAGGPVAEAEALHRTLPDLLLALLRAFDAPAELRAAFEAELRTRPDPDPGGDVGPIAPRALRLMEPIMRRTYCTFAPNARLWAAPDYDPARSFTANMDASLPYLRVFTSILESDVLDGFVYAFPTELFGGEDITDVARLFRAFFGHLWERTSLGGPRWFDRETLLDEHWRFLVYGEQYFITIFAPCYPHSHPRYAYGCDDAVLIMLQPEETIHAHIPHEVFDTRAESIRQRYQDGFQGYDLAKREVDRFLLPVRQNFAPVRWYDLAGMDSVAVHRPRPPVSPSGGKM